MEDKLREYRYGVNTEVKFRGEWQPIVEDWFGEEKIGLKESGHLINFSDVEGIRESTNR